MYIHVHVLGLTSQCIMDSVLPSTVLTDSAIQMHSDCLYLSSVTYQ